MKILIETIPHSEQRYNTVGDYTRTPDGWHIRVSQLPDWREEALIAVHELVELLLCEARGIPDAAIDVWDMTWVPYYTTETGWVNEPGADPSAPYYHEHVCATGVELLLATELGVQWELYESHILALGD